MTTPAAAAPGRIARWRELAQLYPGALLLLGTLSGLLPMLTGWSASAWATVGFAVTTAAVLRTPGALLRLTAGALLGLAAAGWSMRVPAGSYERLVDRPALGAEIKAVVTDTSCAGPAVPWLQTPGWVFAEIRALRFSSSEPWRPVAGALVLRLPQDAPPPAYGDRLELRGGFLPPPPMPEREWVGWNDGDRTPRREAVGAFDFDTYLRARDVRHIFQVRECRADGAEWSPTAWLLQGRNALLRRIGMWLDSDRSRNLAAGLLFGCRQGVDWQSRQDYIRTGTIHVFTVSGFHVGILAWLIFLALRPLPFTWRHLLTPLLLTAYVATTGFNPPAVRTLAMVGVWSVCRGLLLQTPALNLIFLAAAGLLLYNPWNLYDLGFQYSFTVVAFLIAAAPRIGLWCAGIGERLNWIPAPAIGLWTRRRMRWSRELAAAMAGCLVAWLASSVISVHYQGFIFPAAPALNLLIIPFVWLIFIVAGALLALSWLPGLGGVCGGALDALLRGMSGACAATSAGFDALHLCPPPPALAALFALLLAVVIFAESFRWLAAGALLMTLLPAGGVWYARMQPPSLTFVTGGGAPPVVMLCDPSRRLTWVANAPAGDFPRCAEALIRSAGLSRIDVLLLTGSTRDYCGGARQLLAGLACDRLVMVKPRGGSTAAELVKELAAEGTAPMLLPTSDPAMPVRFGPLLRSGWENRVLRFEYDAGGTTISGGFRQDEYGATVLDASSGGRKWAVELDQTQGLEIRTLEMR